MSKNIHLFMTCLILFACRSQKSDNQSQLTDITTSPMKCNGHTYLCDRPFNKAVFAATHNSYAVKSKGFFPKFYNQKRTMTQQLNDGIRGLMLDTHRPKLSINPFNTKHGVPHLCHNKCIAGKQKLVDGLQEISKFLKKNPNEVIIIIFEDKIRDKDGNLKPKGQRVLATHIKEIMDKVALTQYVYTHDHTKGWPTLKEMIKSNKRLVIISEAQGYKSEKDPAPFAWYHHIWSLVKETEYSFESVAKFKVEGKYVCRPNQKRGGPESNSVFLINHWVTWLGAVESATHKANSILLARARECAKIRKSIPTIVAVDFYEQGDPNLIKTVEILNSQLPD